MKPFYFHVIVNETAGAYQAKKVSYHTQVSLNQLGQKYQLTKTQYPNHAIQIAQNLKLPDNDTYQHIVLVIGGDGTLHETVRGLLMNTLLSNQPPVAYIPSGSGNDFRRNFPIPKQSKAILEQILHVTQPHYLDVGRFHGKDGLNNIFINNIGIGIDSRTVHLTNQSKLKPTLNKLKMGNFVYLANLIQAFIAQDTFRVSLNGETYDHIFLVTVANEPYFGGGVPILPKANFDKKELDLILVEKMPIPKLINLFYHVYKDGTHLSDPKVHYFHAKKFSISTTGKEYLQVDGEIFGHQNFNFDVDLVTYPFWLP